LVLFNDKIQWFVKFSGYWVFRFECGAKAKAFFKNLKKHSFGIGLNHGNIKPEEPHGPLFSIAAQK